MPYNSLVGYVLYIVSKAGIKQAFEYLKTKRAKFTPPHSLRAHYAEVVNSLSAMPFIYKDLTKLVIKDYVEISFKELSSKTLNDLHHAPFLNITVSDRIRNRPRALFVGNAGIGKTTFFRYTALSLATKSTSVDHFFPKERLVPFYIPLKIIKDNQPYPIINYLLGSFKYLEGPRGFHRLINLAERKRLFLLLDGYDEIYISPAQQANFLLDELNMVVGGKLPPYGIARKDRELRRLYAALRLCRCWISSRREFYILHPLGFSGEEELNRDKPNSIALSITGLHNRSLLVTKIFNIYRQMLPQTYAKLKDEKFLQEIERTGDDELKNFSFNPLFLTVLCYLYARNMETGRKTDFKEFTLSDLILASIDLLIEDLDKARILDVPESQRALFTDVFEGRRSLWVNEKRAFLGFFANRVLAKNIQVFDEDMIIEAAIYFFKFEYRNGAADEILADLESKQKSEHNFVRQLLNQGIFVLVPKVGGTKLYDFPHRRFREVLAAQYLNTPDRIGQVVENLQNENYAEFIYVFFSVSQFQNQILGLLLEMGANSPEDYSFGTLALNCLRVKPKHYDPTPVLMDWIRSCVELQKRFRIPGEILRYLSPNRETVEWLRYRLRSAVTTGNEHVLAIVAPILQNFDKAILAVIMIEEFEVAISHSKMVATFLYILAEIDPDLVLSRMDILRSRPDIFRSILLVYAIFGDRNGGAKFWNSLEANLFAERVVLADVLRDNPEILPRFGHKKQLADELEWLSVIVRYLRDIPQESFRAILNSKPTQGSFVYIVTHSVLEKVDGAGKRMKLRELMGGVHFSKNKLEMIDRKGELEKAARHNMAFVKDAARILATQDLSEQVVVYFS